MSSAWCVFLFNLYGGFADEKNIPVFSDAFGALQIPMNLRELFKSREDLLLSQESEEVFKIFVPKENGEE